MHQSTTTFQECLRTSYSDEGGDFRNVDSEESLTSPPPPLLQFRQDPTQEEIEEEPTSENLSSPELSLRTAQAYGEEVVDEILAQALDTLNYSLEPASAEAPLDPGEELESPSKSSGTNSVSISSPVEEELAGGIVQELEEQMAAQASSSGPHKSKKGKKKNKKGKGGAPPPARRKGSGSDSDPNSAPKA